MKESTSSTCSGMSLKSVEPQKIQRNRTSPTQFLDLPREVRDEIYRLLFTTPYAYVLGPLRPRYRFSAVPLMRVNHQVHEETKAIFYQENNFVRLKFDCSDAARCARSFCDPLLWASAAEIRVALSIDLEYIHPFDEAEGQDFELSNDEDEDGMRASRCYNYLIGPETFDHFVQGFWEMTRDIGLDAGRSRLGLQHLSMTLDFKDSVFGCREKVQHTLLKPLAKLHGLGEVVVTGAIGYQQGRQLLEQMDSTPSPDFVRTSFDDYTEKAEMAFEAARLVEAIQNWKSAVRYVEFVREITRFDEMEFDDPLGQLLIEMNVEINMLRIRMAGTCLRRCDPHAAYQWIDENNVTWYGRSLHVTSLTCVAEEYAKLMMQEYDSGARSSGPASEAASQTLDDNTAFFYFVLDHSHDPRFGHPDNQKLFLRLCRVWGPVFSSPYIQMNDGLRHSHCRYAGFGTGTRCAGEICL